MTVLITALYNLFIYRLGVPERVLDILGHVCSQEEE